MAELVNLACYKGEAITLLYTFTPATDITGWTLVFTLKRLATDQNTLLSKNATVTNGPLGTFSVALAKADTTLSATVYQYDVQRTDAGSEAVLAIGSFTIQQEVRN